VLNSLEVLNFQSLRKVNVEFGNLTVIIGPSSSGKSAIIRAIRSLARNTNSSIAVSHGEKSFSITATFSDGTIQLIRGKSLSEYYLGDSLFRKSGTSVPEAVEAQIAMPFIGGLDLCLADQFDRPFLIAESGSVTAKVLGDLTNASLLIEVSREANRRQQSHEQKAKLRARDVEALSERIQDYRQLPEEKAALSKIRARLDRARDLEGETVRLRRAVESHEMAETILAQHRASAESLPDVTDHLERAAVLGKEISSLREALTALESGHSHRQELLREMQAAQESIDQLESQEKTELVTMGRCPLCGQNTKGLAE